MALFRTNKHDYTTADDRVWTHLGAVVDLGCDPWDWSSVFIGKKRLIGADPFATQIEGTELFQGVIGTTHGTATITCQGDASTIMFPAPASRTVPMITWKEFKQTYGISSIALLKLNIEGSEYPLLSSMDAEDFAQIDQIAVSFHDWLWPQFAGATQDCLTRLKAAGFTMQKTNELWGWWLGLK